MRKSFIFIVAVATVGLLAAGARAAENFPIGKHGPGEVYNACNAAGGVFAMLTGGFHA